MIANLSGDPVLFQFDQEAVADKFIKDRRNRLYRKGRDDLHAEQDGSALGVNGYETIIYKVVERMKAGGL
ncbi:hypothetical protein WBG83_17805 [Paenibacillus sp. y28]